MKLSKKVALDGGAILGRGAACVKSWNCTSDCVQLGKERVKPRVPSAGKGTRDAGNGQVIKTMCTIQYLGFGLVRNGEYSRVCNKGVLWSNFHVKYITMISI